MTIEKTELAPGLVLKGTYKKQERTVLVLGDADSAWGFELDGQTVLVRSPTSDCAATPAAGALPRPLDAE